MTKRQGIAFLLFGSALFGALAPSFVHVAGWWAAMVPHGMDRLVWVAALVIEGSLFAALYGLYMVPKGMPGRGWVTGLMALGAVASIYANLAWYLRTHAAEEYAWLTWADMLFGAALLPIYAVVTAHAAPYVWAHCSNDPPVPPQPAAIPESESQPEHIEVQPAETQPEPAAIQPVTNSNPSNARKPRKADALAMIRGGDFDHLQTQVELAQALGVSQSSVSRWPVERNGTGWRVEA